MAVVSIQAKSTGRVADVGADADGNGRLLVDINNSEPVTMRPMESAVAMDSGTATTSSAQIAGARDGRTFLEVQNRGANPLFVALGSGSATTSDRQVAPGDTFRLSIAYFGEVQGITFGGSSDYTVIEGYVA